MNKLIPILLVIVLSGCAHHHRTPMAYYYECINNQKHEYYFENVSSCAVNRIASRCENPIYGCGRLMNSYLRELVSLKNEVKLGNISDNHAYQKMIDLNRQLEIDDRESQDKLFIQFSKDLKVLSDKQMEFERENRRSTKDAMIDKRLDDIETDIEKLKQR